jgi:hypothetical protein
MFGITFAICLFGLALLRFWVKEPRKRNVAKLTAKNDPEIVK